MTFVWFDLLQLVVLGVAGYFCYYFYTKGKYKISIGILIVGCILLAYNPVVLEVPDNTRFSTPTQIVPEKVVVEEKSFEEKQAEKFKQLREESKLLEENINE